MSRLDEIIEKKECHAGTIITNVSGGQRGLVETVRAKPFADALISALKEEMMKKYSWTAPNTPIRKPMACASILTDEIDRAYKNLKGDK
jgi:hypothetical protein